MACTIDTVVSGCTKSQIASLQSVFRVLFGVVTILLVLELLRRSRPSNVARYAGLALIAVAFGGPAAWPWYLVWGLALLAAAPTARTVAWSLVIIIAGAFVVNPSGQLAIPLQDAPWVMAVYLGAALVAWYTLRQRRRRGPPNATEVESSPAAASTGRPPESVLVK